MRIPALFIAIFMALFFLGTMVMGCDDEVIPIDLDGEFQDDEFFYYDDEEDDYDDWDYETDDQWESEYDFEEWDYGTEDQWESEE